MIIPTTFPVEDLPRVIEEWLKIAPRVVDELERLTGYSSAAIRLRLDRLETAGRIHRERKGSQGAAGYHYLWHFGPKPATCPPQKNTVYQYEPIGRRDPMVAALFGAGGSMK